MLKFKGKENLEGNKGKRNVTYRERTIKLQLNCLQKTIKPEDNGKSVLNGWNTHYKQKQNKKNNMSPRILSFKISFSDEKELITLQVDKS